MAPSSQDQQAAAGVTPWTLTATALCVVTILVGWAVRDHAYYRPDLGLGYALGIVGLGSMVVLMAYSFRKRFPSMRSLGRVRHWFMAHMVLGVVGPIAILFHCNFRIGSANSAVALAATLTVFGSGLVGRFIYNKIHLRLQGKRQSLERLKEQQERQKARAHQLRGLVPELGKRMDEFEAYALTPTGGGLQRAVHFLRLTVRQRETLSLCRRDLRAAIAQNRIHRFQVTATERAVRSFLEAVRDVAQLAVYERLFSLWHALHIPFIALLFLSAVFHVVAVHMY